MNREIDADSSSMGESVDGRTGATASSEDALTTTSGRSSAATAVRVIQFTHDGGDSPAERAVPFQNGVAHVKYHVDDELPSQGNLDLSYVALFRLSGDPSSERGVEAAELSRNRPQRDSIGRLSQETQPEVSLGSENVTIQAHALGLDAGTPLYLHMDWEYDGEEGSSRSGLFTLTRSSTDSGIEADQDVTAFMRKWRGEEDYWDPGQESPDSLPSQYHLDPTQEDGGGGSGRPTSSGTDFDASASSSAVDLSGGSGLSTGAIAGIAVGAGLLGLALIGALVWFFCCSRRRRRKGPMVGHVGSIGGGAAAVEMVQGNGDEERRHLEQHIVSKETNVRVSESPRSAFSDEANLTDDHAYHSPCHHHNHHQQQQQEEEQRRNSHELSARSHTIATASRSVAEPAATAAAKAGSGSGPGLDVSDLIEEGMTEEEIRRLEEEERALDDAIERAGHARRGS